MQELKYSGFTVASVLGLLSSIIMENMSILFVAIIVGILYELLNK